jgi:2-dehydro-3-deoxyphosphogluconate aldolase/(4S)-4-hydroxy-2-oxoglutarate aldolase
MTADEAPGMTQRPDQAPQLDLASLAGMLSRHRLLPVLRATSTTLLQSMVDMCLEAGLTIIELTTTSPGWEHVLATLKTGPESAKLTVGVGTAISGEVARSALGAGADFLVTPYRVDEVSEVAGQTPVIRGAFSPSELAAAPRGNVVKLFPASALGPAYLRSVLEVLPGAMVVPTGGLTSDSARAWLDAGAIAVGMGSRLFDDGVPGIQALRQTLAG